MFVSTLDMSQDSMEFTKQRTVVSQVTTQFRPSSSPRSSTSRMEQITNEEKQTRSQYAEGNFWPQVIKPRTIACETAGRNLNHCRLFIRRQRHLISSHLNAICVPKTEKAPGSADAVKKALWVPELQERNARMIIEEGSQAIESLTELRIVEQNRRGNRHGSSPSQLQWATMMNSVHQPDAGLQWVAKGVGQKQTSPTKDHYGQAATWARPLWHGREAPQTQAIIAWVLVGPQMTPFRL